MKIQIGLPLLLMLTCFSMSSSGQLSNDNDKKKVAYFIELIRTQQISKLAEHVYYPLKREYPIPAIKNKQEFIKRYKQIFDASLERVIIHSDPAKDWSKVGWRGIMLLQGELWIDGRLISVNHQSVEEKHLRDKLIADDKSGLPVTLRNYRTPVLYMETSKFLIRIDEMEGGKYRYASWSRPSDKKGEPDLTIENGTWTPEGSGGNHYYRFTSGDYQYNCIINVISELGGPPAELTVTKSGRQILKQMSTLLKY
jgi:hypothetical protein